MSSDFPGNECLLVGWLPVQLGSRGQPWQGLRLAHGRSTGPRCAPLAAALPLPGSSPFLSSGLVSNPPPPPCQVEVDKRVYKNIELFKRQDGAGNRE